MVPALNGWTHSVTEPSKIILSECSHELIAPGPQLLGCYWTRPYSPPVEIQPTSGHKAHQCGPPGEIQSTSGHKAHQLRNSPPVEMRSITESIIESISGHTAHQWTYGPSVDIGPISGHTAHQWSYGPSVAAGRF